MCSVQQSCCGCIAADREGAYALFGHSMGAWIVWEMLQEIHRRGLPLPVRLFVSGNRCAASVSIICVYACVCRKCSSRRCCRLLLRAWGMGGSPCVTPNSPTAAVPGACSPRFDLVSGMGVKLTNHKTANVKVVSHCNQAMPACWRCRAPCLHGKQHDVDPTLMHTLTPDKFWPHFKQRYGENKHLVRSCSIGVF